MSASEYAPTVVIENVAPQLGKEAYLIKRVLGTRLTVSADIYKDGHDIVVAKLQWRLRHDTVWREADLEAIANDRWQADCEFDAIGRWDLQIQAWPDGWRTWKKYFKAKIDAADPEVSIEVREGALLLEAAAQRAVQQNLTAYAAELREVARLLRTLPVEQMLEMLFSEDLQTVMDLVPDRSMAVVQAVTEVQVERQRAQFSAWYEFFPRSAEGRLDKHSTFRDCLPRLDDAQRMGFDVIYFPPIHPIGVSHRKGKNNTLVAYADDVGSPWAIGASTGGHRSIEPALGTLEDFHWLLAEAAKRGLEIAMDFAINCSPDHPYVKEHPEWFYQREDGSIRYAENPPKKYQDIYPLNFHCADWKNLWKELADVVLFWVEQGVKIFRVDNPHTKPVAFWQYLITEVQAQYPDVIFLAEAFTKPRMMQVLGKIGFSQSYTYFTWRESKQQLREYVEELTQGEMRWYYRANFWPNTPDILPGHLQHAGPASFRLRAALAATLVPSWGIYSGFELCENQPLPGREEYLDSEKYQLKQRDWDAPNSIKGFIAQLNQIRRENVAFLEYDNVQFHDADHPDILIYSKVSSDLNNRMLMVINLNPHQVASSMVHLNLNTLGLHENVSYSVNDLLHGTSYPWHGAHNYVSLDPQGVAMHVFQIRLEH